MPEEILKECKISYWSYRVSLGYAGMGTGEEDDPGVLHGGRKMTGYKGTNKDMACTKGSGTFPYQLGLNRADQAKARSTGLHFTEDPFLVLNWYPLGSDNRYFLCEASGDINETNGEDSMACTELTIIRELTVKELAGHGMMFMLRHPLRGWGKKKDHAAGEKGTGRGFLCRLNRHCQRKASEGERKGWKFPGTAPGRKWNDYRSKAV